MNGAMLPGTAGARSSGSLGGSSSSQTKVPSPAGTQRGPSPRMVPRSGLPQESTPPSPCTQLKLRPLGVEQVVVRPRLLTQVSVSPPSQPLQVSVPSELFVQNTSNVLAWLGAARARPINPAANRPGNRQRMQARPLIGDQTPAAGTWIQVAETMPLAQGHRGRNVPVRRAWPRPGVVVAGRREAFCRAAYHERHPSVRGWGIAPSGPAAATGPGAVVGAHWLVWRRGRARRWAAQQRWLAGGPRPSQPGDAPGRRPVQREALGDAAS